MRSFLLKLESFTVSVLASLIIRVFVENSLVDYRSRGKHLEPKL